MSVSRSLTFLGTPWSVAASRRGRAGHGGSLLCEAGAAAVFGRRWDCSNLLRLALVGMVAVLLNQPEWIEEFRPRKSRRLRCLWDASASMDTRDVVAGGDGAAQPVTRREAIARLADPSIVEHAARADERHHPADFRAAAGTRHRLERAAGRSADKGRRICAASCWPPTVIGTRAAAGSGRRRRLRHAGVPIFAVPVGSRTRLARCRAFEPGRADLRHGGQIGPHPVSIDSSLRATIVTTVTLRRRDGDEVTKEVRIAADEPHQRFAHLEAESDGRLYALADCAPSTATNPWPTTTS